MLSLLCFISLFFLLESYKPNLCINCKYFIKSTDMRTDPKYGTCAKYIRTDEELSNYLVTGVKEDVKYFYCSTVRKHYDMCGPDGKDYVMKEPNTKKIQKAKKVKKVKKVNKVKKIQ